MHVNCLDRRYLGKFAESANFIRYKTRLFEQFSQHTLDGRAIRLLYAPSRVTEGDFSNPGSVLTYQHYIVAYAAYADGRVATFDDIIFWHSLAVWQDITISSDLKPRGTDQLSGRDTTP
jgi:hypothetical protein